MQFFAMTTLPLSRLNRNAGRGRLSLAQSSWRASNLIFRPIAFLRIFMYLCGSYLSDSIALKAII